MAETVKKSRIVSDDDLEESLMQEFNIRLKHCMSQEQMQEPSDDEDKEDNVKEIIKMEFNNSVTTNGKKEDSIYDEVCPINSSEKFLNEERNVYVGTNGVSLKNGLNDDTHDKNLYENETPQKQETEVISPIKVTEDVIYDEVRNVRPVLQLPTTCLVDMSDTNTESEQDTKSSVKDRMLLSTDDASCLLFTQTVTSPMLTPSEENIDFLKGFQRQSSQNTTSNSENTVSSKLEDVDQQNEDVTESNISDKLEIEYENVQQTNTEGEISEADNVASNVSETNQDDGNIQSENIYEIIEDDEEKQEQIYENMEILRRQSNDKQCSSQEFLEREISEEQKSRFEDNVYENIEDTEEEDIELSNAESIEDLQSDLPEKSIPDVCLEASEKLDSASKYPEVENQEVCEQPTMLNTNEISLDDEVQQNQNTTPQIVENLTKQHHEEITDSTDEMDEVLLENVEVPPPEQNKINNLADLLILESEDIEDKSIDNPSKMVDALKTKFLSNTTAEIVKTASIEKNELNQLKTVDIMKQIHRFENKSPAKEDEDEEDENTSSSTEMTESTYVETTTTVETSSSAIQDKSLKKKKSKKSRNHDKENISVKSSFNKFDALQKKNVLHVRSSDSSKAQEKFNGAAPIDITNCKACGKVVFQMEQIKAEKSVWHKNCFRCQECSKQLTVDTYQSNEGAVYCKPHFKSLFAPKAVEDEAPPSDKPDLGLEELQSLNVKERFQVFENYEEQHANSVERGQVNVKRSASILSKLAKFQAKGMDVGVTDDSLNGIPIEESTSEEEQEEEEIEGEDADLIRAKRAQKEKPFHFTGMSDVKSKWEHGEQNTKDVRREERKQEIQSIRDKLFMGKQGKMKEAYQQAVMESESCSNMKKLDSPPVEACDTRSLKERFEKGETFDERKRDSKDAEEMAGVFESGISKKSRSIFLELDANASKAPQLSPVSPNKSSTEVRKAREAFMARQASEDTIRSSEQVDDIKVETADIQQRFKFFEAYKEPEQKRKAFRITPPREGQVKTESPDREVYRDPDIIRAEEQVEDSVIAKESHTTTKVLNKFRQMEENQHREPLNLGPKPLKRFTPPPEPTRPESSSEAEGSESEEESDELDEIDQSKMQDADLIEAQKAARARQLRAKFEKWEAKEIKREQQQVNLIEEVGEEQAQIESTRALRARFESLKESQNEVRAAPKVKVNRFVDTTSNLEVCYSCKERVYPLEKISINEQTYHKKCFKCKECNTILRMDSYTHNQGFLYCMPHFKRLFIAKGNYDTAFGLEQHQEKWNTTVA